MKKNGPFPKKKSPIYPFCLLGRSSVIVFCKKQSIRTQIVVTSDFFA